MDECNKKLESIDSIGLILIGLFSFAYVLLKRIFAELNIQFSWLNFPIFVGELLLLMCFVLFCVKMSLLRPKLSRNEICILCFFIFVILKALVGYIAWGPLALRNAALFYYFSFIVFGYTFYNHKFFNKDTILCCFFLILWLFFSEFYDFRWTTTALCLAIILTIRYPPGKIRQVMIALLIMFVPFKVIFDNATTSRMMLAGNVLSFILISVLFACISKAKKSTKVISFALGLVIIFTSVVSLSRLVEVKSIFKFKSIISTYQDNVNKVEDRTSRNVSPVAEITDKVKIFNLEETRILSAEMKNITTLGRFNASLARMAYIKTSDFVQEKFGANYSDALSEERKKKKPSIEGENRHEGTIINNIVFRLLIWRDMIIEIKEHKPLLGFDFGRPLRSRSLEMIGWAKDEWARDGWITAHNSYLHIIYRAGIIGLLLIIFIFIRFFEFIRISLYYRSVKGIFLCGVILIWFFAANFILIFELPYTAIPIWSLFGMALAYSTDLKSENRWKFTGENGQRKP